MELITPSGSTFDHSAFEGLQDFTSRSQAEAYKRCNVLLGAYSDTKMPNYIPLGIQSVGFMQKVLVWGH